MQKSLRPFGLWTSPITPGSLAEGKRLDGVEWDSNGNTLVWLEGRSGKGVLVARTGDDAPRDLTAELSVRAEVGYGGGDFTVHGSYAYFVVHKTGRIFRQRLSGGAATPITSAFGQAASPVVSPDGRWVAYIHYDGEGNDRIAVVDSAGATWPQILASGHDFFMQPRFSPDGRRFAWIAWDHPNMPWDGTTLWLADVLESEFAAPRLGEPRAVAGGTDVAVFQGEFTPDGRHLLYVSDESGWGRLTAHEIATGQSRTLTSDSVECASPAWTQGQRTYAVLPTGEVVVAAGERGFQSLRRIDLATGDSEPVAELADYSEIASVVASHEGRRVAIIASSPVSPPRVVTHDFELGRTQVVARSSGETVPASALARCEALTWKTAGGEPAHGLYYAPASEGFECQGKPPLVVLIHGGPTSQIKAGWRSEGQFFATRGYGVLFVNYRGSTGYGREYMLKLRGNWGVCDIEDAVSGMRHLAELGRIDGNRTVIMGGSAGGFTVLQTMVNQPEAFTAGISLYGVANQFSLAADTHKFESRYLDTMLGPLPEASAVYRERSPVFHAAKIRRPLAVFQGSIDTVVPKDQSDSIVEALKHNGTPHIYHVYEREGHGWRKRETIEHFYQAVDDFLRRYLVFA
ncbi:MAG TPA: S9 family peptidase [Pirellulales bacterium]|jgi:dipeptidyl aminopeptidase/acylaminoacyl peptidase|nr:S9 family peptidase [Pirellulales bacterium]